MSGFAGATEQRLREDGSVYHGGARTPGGGVHTLLIAVRPVATPGHTGPRGLSFGFGGRAVSTTGNKLHLSPQSY